MKITRAGFFTRYEGGRLHAEGWVYRKQTHEESMTKQQTIAAILIHIASENGISLIEAGAVDREVKMTLESEREALNILERVKKT